MVLKNSFGVCKQEFPFAFVQDVSQITCKFYSVKRIPNLVPLKEVIELTLTPIIGIPCFVLVFTVLG